MSTKITRYLFSQAFPYPILYSLDKATKIGSTYHHGINVVKPDQLLHQFLQQLNAVISPGADVLGKEAQQKIKAAAQATFDKLDLVTRDEFDAQRAVLARSREKIEQMEKLLAELEARLENQQN